MTIKINYEAIANVILKRSSLQPGERVLLIAKPGDFDSLILLLKNKIIEAKAEFLGAISIDTNTPEAWQTKFTHLASGKLRDELSEYFRAVDLGIMMPGADTTHAPYAAMQQVLRDGQGRTIHFHWAGAYATNGFILERSQQVDEIYEAALLQTDYQKLYERQKQFENAARKDIIRVTTPLGTDIQFSIGNRPVTKQDGDASKIRSDHARNLIDREVELPAGAIRVAPLEESVVGKIAFPEMQWNGSTVKGLIMQFREGKIIDVIATEGLEVVKAELNSAGALASSFRELAVGFNSWLAIPDIGPQWIPYYGYGAGVIRLSLGDNTELGGKVAGGYVRWNFFTDATLYIGDEMWIKDGKLLRPVQ